MGFFDVHGFELMQRVAKMLTASTLMPEAFRGADGLPNAIIALNMAQRMQADPLMVCQNLDVIHGRPSWRATFLIACFNQSGRFSALRYRWQGTEGKDDWGCRAWAIEKATGEEIIGPLVTIALAKAEKWYERTGSKWKTIPELMLTYRAAAWMIRTHAPEIGMGLPTQDEADDIVTLSREEYSVAQVASGEHAKSSKDGEGEAQTTKPTPKQPAPAEEEREPAAIFTYAQVAAAINEATTTDALDLAVDMIRSVADERQRAELDIEAKKKRKAIAA
jgi:hypothetical protein